MIPVRFYLTMQSVSYAAIENSLIKSPPVTETKSARTRTDGRKSLLLYMDAAMIKELKKAALDDDTTSYEIVEQATRQWLDRRVKKARAK